MCFFPVSLQFLQKEFPPRIEADPESLFVLAYQIKYNAKKMKKLEKEYAAMKTKEQEEMVELRVSFLFPMGSFLLCVCMRLNSFPLQIYAHT